jgi:anti-anti-sigma regulatory factor
MMRIEIKDLESQLILQVEGRLAGAFVSELQRCWHSARATRPELKIALDLKGVTCVDPAGRRLLQLMRADGVDFLRVGMTLQDLLDCQV